jgi:hypothetical protein
LVYKKYISRKFLLFIFIEVLFLFSYLLVGAHFGWPASHDGRGLVPPTSLRTPGPESTKIDAGFIFTPLSHQSSFYKPPPWSHLFALLLCTVLLLLLSQDVSVYLRSRNVMRKLRWLAWYSREYAPRRSHHIHIYLYVCVCVFACGSMYAAAEPFIFPPTPIKPVILAIN